MSKDSKETKDKEGDRLYDVRLLERNIKRGLLTRKDYDKHLKSLPDVKDKAAKLVDTGSSASDDAD
jgi:hypothetical protein